MSPKRVRSSRDRTEINYCTDQPDPQQYFLLFETTGWNKNYRAKAGQLKEALNNSWRLICAYDGNQLVGFGRVVSDGILYAMIYDLIVIPSHQGRGIGSEMLNRLITECQTAGLRSIQLFAAAGKLSFYEKRGFVQRPLAAPGMVFVAERF